MAEESSRVAGMKTRMKAPARPRWRSGPTIRRTARSRLVDEHEAEVAQREVVEREAPAPRLGERRLEHYQHRQEERQRRHDEAVAQHRPAPRTEWHDPALAALAGEGHVALAGDDAALQPEEEDG